MSCGYEEQNNCRRVLAKYHKLLKEAECLFEESEELIDKYAIRSIINALKALGKSIKLHKEAVEIEECAKRLLEESDCDRYCNKDSRRCKEKLEKAEKDFFIEQKLVFKTMELLEEALCNLKRSIEFRNRGKKQYKEYVECIHERKPSPSPCDEDSCNCNCR